MSDITTINGLHKCQPKNAPKAGIVKNMIVQNMPAKQGKRAWIKIKSEKPEKGGSPYRILGVEKLEWPPDDYGNIAFNIEVEASSSPPSTVQNLRATMQQGEREYDDNRIYPPDDRYDTPEKAKNAPQSPPQRFSMLDERQRAIIRQHSQSMALEVLKLKVTLNELTVGDLTPVKLRALADYFDQDVIGANIQ